jgi:copper(I)-binding protein
MIPRRPILVLPLVAGLLAASAAAAEDYRAGDVRIERPWARATAGNARVGAVYFTLEAVGAAPDRLLWVASPVAAVSELHAHMMHDNVMQMRPVGAIEVNPGTPTVLQPGGLHVMLMELKGPLKEGERIALTLQFERAGRVDIMVPVERAGARGPAGGEGGGMPMHHKPPGS